jgi:hypothetical protein
MTIEHAFPSVPEDNTVSLEPIDCVIMSPYGRPYLCHIDINSMITLPEGLVRELKLHVGDDLSWTVDEETGIVHVEKVYRPWAPPEWLDDNY